MELAGTALNLWLKNKNKKLEEAYIQILGRQIVSAVSYIHKRGIIHRDLKFDNILVNDDDRIKIIGKILRFHFI